MNINVTEGRIYSLFGMASAGWKAGNETTETTNYKISVEHFT